MQASLDNPNLSAVVESEQFQLRLPSRLDWIQPAVEYLRQRAVLCGACDEMRSGRVMLALHEALTNSVVHGNLELSSELKEREDNAFAEELASRAADPAYSARTVDVDVVYDGESCRWTIADQGKGFDVEGMLQRDPADGSEQRVASGRGILMMRAFLDDVQYLDGGRRVSLTLLRASAKEKRRQPRRPMEQALHVAPLSEDGTVDWNAAQDALSRNVSAEGMALLQARLANAGRIVIASVGEGEPVYLAADVRHWRQLDPELIEIGCRFIATPAGGSRSEQAAPEIDGALHALIEGYRNRLLAPDERRAYQRSSYTQRIGIEGGAATEATVGFARDLSKGGIAFIATRPLPLEIRILSLPQGDGSALRIQAQIVRCMRIMDGYFDIGARFLALE